MKKDPPARRARGRAASMLDVRIRELDRESKSRLHDALRSIDKLHTAVDRLCAIEPVGDVYELDSELKFVLAHAESLREADRRRCTTLATIEELRLLRERLAAASKDNPFPRSKFRNRKDSP